MYLEQNEIRREDTHTLRLIMREI